MAQPVQIKAESPYIKPDPDAFSGSAVALPDEDDLYEDAGDLEFFDSAVSQGSFDQAYLAKVPKEIWDAWSKLPDDADIEVGTMRQWDVIRPDGTIDHRFRMLLNTELAGHQLVPREYDLEMNPDISQNTYVFTEEDLPTFNTRSKARNDAASGIPAHLLRARTEKVKERPARKPFDRKAKWQPYYRKAIPKRTKIAARIQYEMGCKPVDNEENRAILQLKQMEAQKPKHTLKIVDHHQISGVIQQGSAAAQAKFGSFVKTTNAVKATKQKKLVNKAIRMDEAELREALLDAFTNRYQYWKMSVLKATFNQPEAYLRQELEKVAALNRSGPHANEWELKPEFKFIQNQALAESAPDAGPDEDDELDLVDVLPDAST
ncbi:transcription initiation factor iif [Sodiomyces alkalinus F11]|uniref:Transcription initiation factor IIF subunit beta n=1 Tax=Sodiomyces alkalinus (strain CBS 110278 / VKM F-3762 / F11) TaxID=1314773 RepID=A0A3N2Q084_SODAK|nr:transcription initiation factor iif [Sodiomyces alkalinus F11]ROT40096.1 transcription initiation factor iif [Sodiomyces alkalinus F11]